MQPTKKLYLFFSFLSFLFLACDVDRVDLNNTYNESQFPKDFSALLKAEKIDSLIYYKGIILQNNANRKGHWESTMKYSDIVRWIHSQTNISGNISQQKYEDNLIEFNMEKEYKDSTNIDFKLDIQLNDLSLINENDTVKFWVSHYNFVGEQSSAMVLQKEISKTSILTKKVSFEYAHEVDEYEEDFQTWKYDRLNEVPERYFGLYSNFKVLKYFIVRNEDVIYEMELE